MFQELKMTCLTVPVLAFADFEKPFLLETEASIEGLGAVLSQKQDDGWYHPVTYASQGLKGGESRYHSSKLEFPGPEMGCDRPIQGVPTVSALPCLNGQQSADLCHDDAQFGCHWA